MARDDREIIVLTEQIDWPEPWHRVAELAEVLPSEHWTLIGGLMVQLHALHRGIDAVRPTNDIDLIIHVETARGRPTSVARALEDLGYEIQPSLSGRTAHRFVRGDATIDVVAQDVVDVVAADHAAPSTLESLRGYPLVQIEGGTQALRRTVNFEIDITSEARTRLSVPAPFGALVLKAAAHQTDSRDRERHLSDAATLLACIDDPFALEFEGSDRKRILHLHKHLGDPRSRGWLHLPQADRSEAQSALAVLAGRTG